MHALYISTQLANRSPLCQLLANTLNCLSLQYHIHLLLSIIYLAGMENSIFPLIQAIVTTFMTLQSVEIFLERKIISPGQGLILVKELSVNLILKLSVSRSC